MRRGGPVDSDEEQRSNNVEGLWWIHHGKDLNLVELIDVAAFSEAAVGRSARFWEALTDTTVRHELQRPVFCALTHIAVLFPSAVPRDVLGALRPTDEQYLDEDGEMELREARSWDTDFVTRHFFTDRAAQVPGSRVPE